MRYSSLDSMWETAVNDIIRSGQNVGSRDGACRELIPWTGELRNPDKNFMTNRARCADPTYAAAELLWYLSGSRDAKMMIAYAPQYKRFTNQSDDGPHLMAWGAYGYRMTNDWSFVREGLKLPLPFPDWALSQVRAVVKVLTDKSDSRQAVMTLWNAGDIIHAAIADMNDLPCTLSLQFLIRAGRLNLVATMRSNDVWLGMPYDVFCFTCIQRLVADALKLPLGSYFHHVGSMHLYDRDYAKAERALGTHDYVELHNDWLPVKAPIWDNVANAVNAERLLRNRTAPDDEAAAALEANTAIMAMNDGTLLSDCVRLCAQKWYPAFAALAPRSNLIAEALRRKREKEATHASR